MKKIVRIVALVFCLILLVGPLAAGAVNSYQTYTYDEEGWSALSPAAYTPDNVYDWKDMGLPTALGDPRDFFVCNENDKVYIADKANGVVIVLNEYLQYEKTISAFCNSQGVPDCLAGPQGVFVRNDKIYVADTDNNRIVIFDMDGNFLSMIETPESDVFPEGAIYKPVSLAVDQVGRIYVISSTTYMGIITLNPDGEFVGFIGATEVNISTLDLLWRRFMSKEQRASMNSYVSTEYNNIAIDEGNFLYVTTSSIEGEKQQASIKDNEKKNSPIRKYNANGIDVLKRNGFFGPGGEVQVVETYEDAAPTEGVITGASEIVDVALGKDGVYSIIDTKRSKVFTYDKYGQLLYVFGDIGQQLGNVQSASAIDYQSSNILVLDKTNCTLTVFRRTEYGDLLAEAIHNRENRRYDTTISDWEKIKQRNNNFDAAYIGIGNGYKNKSDYTNAMEQYKAAYDVSNYSEAFKALRQDWVTKYPLVIILVIVVVVIAYALFFKYAGKVNVAGHTKTTRRTFWEEIMYGFWVIFHPFDGFWDLKHEKRGSVRGAIFYIFITIAAFTYKSVGSGYIMNPHNTYANIFSVAVSVIIPILLWCTANWCLTTLFDGEGSFKDIFIATGYALVPMAMFVIPTTLATHIIIEGEIQLINLLCIIGYVWTGLLVVLGSMVTHDYSFGKNLLICIVTVVGIAFIVFLALLFFSLINKIIGFVVGIVVEVTYRI